MRKHYLFLAIAVLFFALAEKKRARRQRRPSLIQTWKNHQGQLADKWESYLHIYSRVFAEYRRRSLTRILEIGVLNGGSLQIWSAYFGIGRAEVVGLDITKEICERLEPAEETLGEDISLECMDATEPSQMSSFSKEQEPFDIIIDDASHRSADIIKTFQLLFPLLSPGGTYSIEDLDESYQNWAPAGTRIATVHTAVSYFTRLIDLVNVFLLTTQNPLPSKLNQDEIYYCLWLESVQFHDGIIILRKRQRPRDTPPMRIMIGEDHVLTLKHQIREAKRLGHFDNSGKIIEEGAVRGRGQPETCRATGQKTGEDEEDGDEIEEGNCSGNDQHEFDLLEELPYKVFINDNVHYHAFHLFFYFHSLQVEGKATLRARAVAFCAKNWLFFQAPGCDMQIFHLALKELGAKDDGEDEGPDDREEEE